MNIEQINGLKRKIITPKPKKKRKEKDHDVMIKLYPGGENRTNICFRFYRNAKDAFKDVNYIEPTSVEAFKDRIYFILHDNKAKGNYTLNKRSGFNFQITPRDKEEDIYRLYWVNKKLDIKYDEECGVYYVERDK